MQFEGPPNLWLLLKEQVAAVMMGTFDKTVVYQLHPFLDGEALFTVTHILVTSWLDYHNVLVHEAAHEDSPEINSWSRNQMP